MWNTAQFFGEWVIPWITCIQLYPGKSFHLFIFNLQYWDTINDNFIPILSKSFQLLFNGHLVKFSLDIIKIFAIVHISTNSRANMKKSISVDPECWYAITISTMIMTTGSKVKNISPSAPGWLFCYLDIELNIEHIAPIMKYFHQFAFPNCLVICS